MSITFTGMVLIPLCVYFFLFKQRYLFNLAVFSIPFTGTAFFVLHGAQLANDERGLGIRVSIILFSLLFLMGLVKAAKLARFHMPFLARWYLTLILILTLTIVLSQMMPLYISGSFNVVDSYKEILAYADEIPLYYDIQWATQALYFVFGCLVSMYLVIHLGTSDLLISTLRIYLYSTIFVSAWGLIEWLLYQLSVPYPYQLFNHNSASFGGSMELYGMVRITSVALEPSILSQQLITTLPFFLFKEKGAITVLSPALHKLGAGMIILVLMLSTSATAYIGLLFVLIWYYFSLDRITYNTILIRSAITIFFIGVVLGLSDYIYGIVMYKIESFSGNERLMSVMYAVKYFVNYPILGIGWGVMPSWDLLFCVLAGSGLIGFVVMFMLFAQIIVTLLKIRAKEYGYEYVRKSSLLSFVSLLLVSQLSGFIYHSLYFWFILGFVVAVIVHITNVESRPVASSTLVEKAV